MLGYHKSCIHSNLHLFYYNAEYVSNIYAYVIQQCTTNAHYNLMDIEFFKLLVR